MEKTATEEPPTKSHRRETVVSFFGVLAVISALFFFSHNITTEHASELVVRVIAENASAIPLHELILERLGRPEAPRLVKTNERGIAVFQNLPHGPYRLWAENPACQKKRPTEFFWRPADAVEPFGFIVLL